MKSEWDNLIMAVVVLFLGVAGWSFIVNSRQRRAYKRVQPFRMRNPREFMRKTRTYQSATPNSTIMGGTIFSWN